MAQSETPLGPVHRIGRYTLFKKLAVGGMAEVWLARQDGELGRFVAIKKIITHLADDEDLRAQFLHEGRVTAPLSHPNIAQVFELEADGDTYYLAMELVLGESLAALAQRAHAQRAPLPAGLAARIVADAAKGLHHAHTARAADGRPLALVHRDVSPQNILVSYDGDVKLIDFGVAKASIQTQHSPPGEVKGKFSYMSPEQCLAEPVDRRSDVFSLGVVLYELCTGKRLFKSDSQLVIMDMITRRPVQPPRDAVPSVPAELDRIVMRAIAKDPAARHQSAEELGAELQVFLHSQPDATGAALAAYMGRLFAEEREAKQHLLARAVRELPEGVEPTVRSPARRRVAPARPRPGADAVSVPLPRATQSRAPAREARAPHDGEPPHARPLARAPLAVHRGAPSGTPSGRPHTAAPHPHTTGAHPHPHTTGAHPHPHATGARPHPHATGARPHPHAFTPRAAATPIDQLLASLPPSARPPAYGTPVVAPFTGLTADQLRARAPSWPLRALLVLSLVVLSVTGTAAVFELRDRARTSAGVRVGSIAIVSTPADAELAINGVPVDWQGRVTRTPVPRLGGLRYGSTYTIALTRPGYQPATHTLRMDATTDGQTVSLTLVPEAGARR